MHGEPNTSVLLSPPAPPPAPPPSSTDPRKPFVPKLQPAYLSRHLTPNVGCNSNIIASSQSKSSYASKPADLAFHLSGARVTLRPSCSLYAREPMAASAAERLSCAGPLQIGPLCCCCDRLACEYVPCTRVEWAFLHTRRCSSFQMRFQVDVGMVKCAEGWDVL